MLNTGNLIYHDTPQLPCTSQYSDSFLRFYPMADLPTVGDYGTLKAMYIAVRNEWRKEKMTLNQEPFVSADEAAKFLGIKRRFLLSLARRGIAGAYALGTGGIRRDLGIPALRTRRCYRLEAVSFDPWQSPLRGAFMAYQRGSLKKVPRKEGDTWVLRYRVATCRRKAG